MNWDQWNLGSRTQWNITKDFYVGVDVIYSKFDTATLGAANLYVLTPSAAVGKNLGFYSTANQDAFSGTFRVHRDIVP